MTLKGSLIIMNCKYEVNETLADELENRFTYHAPHGDQQERYVDIRKEILTLAHNLCLQCPPSRELSTALTHLDAAMMFANAAIARNENPT